MKYEYLHPRDELVLTRQRIYRCRMTTMSGGSCVCVREVATSQEIIDALGGAFGLGPVLREETVS